MSNTEPTGPTGQSESDASPIQRRHGTEILRGLQDVPRSRSYEGRFGRLFRTLPPCIAPEIPDDRDGLDELAAAMLESEDDGQDEQGEQSPFDNPAIPAGFTYFGQFIDHDITFDPTSKLQRQNDPNALKNFRTPRYDLDSVYAGGPDDAPYMYRNDGIHLLTGINPNGEDDLPRNSPAEREPRRALIGDPRNDENVIISQLQLAFLKFHNNVVDAIAGECPRDQRFDEARRLVRWHYQWVVVHDFLVKIVGQDVVDDILRINGDSYKVPSKNGAVDVHLTKANLKFYKYKDQPFMPVEFSVAAYRFGHSMVRPEYELNDVAQNIPIFSLDDENDHADLRGFRERPSQWQIQWNRFFAFPDSGDNLQLTRKIDTKLAPGLGNLPPSIDEMRRSLALRNLRRGKALAVPSGQAVARAMGIPEELVLTDDQLGLPPDLVDTFGDNTPLWYYILREAEVHCDGAKLGPVGGRIVAEVLIGLLQGDPLSYLNAEPGWTPEANRFGAGPNGEFGMAELLQFATSMSTPGDTGGDGPPSSGLHVGGSAWVLRAGGQPLRLRSTPSLKGAVLEQLPVNTLMTLLDGPQQADGHAWWHVRVSTNNHQGWAAEDGLVDHPN